jgi:hypothetical protein
VVHLAASLLAGRPEGVDPRFMEGKFTAKIIPAVATFFRHHLRIFVE